ncbi:MAG: hypothetical protein D6831_03775, partial [Aquificota bacterium]
MKIPIQLKDEIIENLDKILKFFDYTDIDKNNLRSILENIKEISPDTFTEFYNHLLSLEEIKKILEDVDIK